MDQADQLLQRGGYGGGYPSYGRPTQPMGNPPRIVSSSPADGAKDVDPATAQVTITFNQDMGQGITFNGEGASFPFLPGANASWRDRRTCVLPVKLEPGRSYRIALNQFSPNDQSFRSAQGAALMPTTICFATRGTSAQRLNNLVEQVKAAKPV
jgi:RNA polymerase sigma-70 factor (ECF subfamily)